MNTETEKTKTILFVEDNSVVLKAYQNRLEQDGFRVESAGDGLEAMKLLSMMVPDLVILDLLLPKFNGAEVLKFIHSQPRLKSVPVFILSTSSILGAEEEPVLQRAEKRLLKKTFTPTVMAQAVQKLFANRETGAAGNASTDAQPGKPKTIVFIEDNTVVLTAYRHRFQAAGFAVKTAQDGLEAMKLLSQIVPDVIVLDLMLPKFNGVEVLKFIQSNARLATVPVIVLSTNSIIDASEEYVLEGAEKRLLKSSCTPAIVVKAVHELLYGGPATGKEDGPAAETKTFENAKIVA